MAFDEKLLQEKTYKGDGNDIGHRVFCTLTDDASESVVEKATVHRTARALAALIARLEMGAFLDEADIDQILGEAVS